MEGQRVGLVAPEGNLAIPAPRQDILPAEVFSAQRALKRQEFAAASIMSGAF